MNDNNSQKYTCYGSETSCSTLYYVKESYPAHANSLELRDGIDEVQALSVMNKPMYDSSIKKVVDAWYLNNFYELEKDQFKYTYEITKNDEWTKKWRRKQIDDRTSVMSKIIVKNITGPIKK